jgi:hypothetical protein
MRKLLIVIMCMAATGWVLCQPAVSQSNFNDVAHPFQAASDFLSESKLFSAMTELCAAVTLGSGLAGDAAACAPAC